MKKILIVDDEKEIRDLIAKKLAQNEYTTLTAASGKEALSICKTDPPDLILLDIAMPEMDGYEICTKLKKEPATQDTPVLLLTAKDLDPKGIIERYKNTGACGYISKPATFKELLEKIKGVIG